MNLKTSTARRNPKLSTPTSLGADATRDISGALNAVLRRGLEESSAQEPPEPTPYLALLALRALSHDAPRYAHDLRDQAHTLTARAAIKGGLSFSNEVQELLAQACSLEREASGLLRGLTAPVASRGVLTSREF